MNALAPFPRWDVLDVEGAVLGHVDHLDQRWHLYDADGAIGWWRDPAKPEDLAPLLPHLYRRLARLVRTFDVGGALYDLSHADPVGIRRTFHAFGHNCLSLAQGAWEQDRTLTPAGRDALEGLLNRAAVLRWTPALRIVEARGGVEGLRVVLGLPPALEVA